MGVVVRQLGPNVTIRYPDVPIYAPERARRVVFELAQTFFNLGLQEIAGRISEAAPVGVTGNLAQSFGGGASGGLDVRGATIETLEGRVFSSLPYAVVIDQGREPGRRPPPVDAIALWVERVLGIGGAETENVAYVIARSIGRKGIKGRQFVAEGVEKATPRLDQIFASLADAIATGLTSEGPASPGPGGTGL